MFSVCSKNLRKHLKPVDYCLKGIDHTRRRKKEVLGSRYICKWKESGEYHHLFRELHLADERFLFCWAGVWLCGTLTSGATPRLALKSWEDFKLLFAPKNATRGIKKAVVPWENNGLASDTFLVWSAPIVSLLPSLWRYLIYCKPKLVYLLFV